MGTGEGVVEGRRSTTAEQRGWAKRGSGGEETQGSREMRQHTPPTQVQEDDLSDGNAH